MNRSVFSSRFIQILFCGLIASLPSIAASQYVSGGQSLQQAIDQAVPGDTITLQAGATFQGNFKLRNKTGSGWITIQSSMMSSLPEGRVNPSHAPYMAHLVSPNSAAVITADAGAHNYIFKGLRMAAKTGVQTQNIVLLGTGNETALSQLPYAMQFDRVYIHGDPVVGGKRGITMNSGSTTVTNSYFSDFKSTSQDTQAIAGWAGPGPYEILNNYLEASGENIMFGGATADIPNMVPSDITIRNNYLFKPLSWKKTDPTFAGTAWAVKNLFELKNARRVTVDSNVMENNWASAQAGIAVQLTVRTQGGAMPWAVVEDVTFTNNLVRNVEGGMNILGQDDNGNGLVGITQNITVRNNVFDNVNGLLFQILTGAKAITIDHNTGFQTKNAVALSGIPGSGLVYRNNISPRGTYGIFGSGKSEGKPSLDWFFPNSVVTNNVIAGAPAKVYPAGNYFPTSLDNVRFVDRNAGNYALAGDSPYRGMGSDGLDLGAALTLDVKSVVEGTIRSSSSQPGTQPTVSIWSTANVTEEWRLDQPVTLGVRFRSDVPGKIVGIRFWKSSASDNGTHVGALFSNGGALLAQAPFTSETASGWQTVKFETPVEIQASTTFLATYHSTSGWSATAGYFASAGADAPPLHALQSGVEGYNGLYSYGTQVAYPTNSNSANFWVDVMFAPN